MRLYAQDAITAGNLQINIGLRVERYDGLVSENGLEPRRGLPTNSRKPARCCASPTRRTLETPFNENLAAFERDRAGGLEQNVFGSQSAPIEPGFRNQFNTGLQQGSRRARVMPITSGSTRIMPTTSARS